MILPTINALREMGRENLELIAGERGIEVKVFATTDELRLKIIDDVVEKELRDKALNDEREP